MKTVAVFDVGKTNVKLSAVTPDGTLVETLSAPNHVHDDPPFRHHDLAGLEEWLLHGLRDLGTRHTIEAIVSSAHGSGGVLIDTDGPALPMVDYEQSVPLEVEEEYRRIVGSFRERGSAVMLGAAHLARQMLWMERCWPEEFSRAQAFLATPQYWAWRLSGVTVSEVTSLAAQSHLWSPAEERLSKLVSLKGWGRLIPPLRSAWDLLGPLKPELALRTGLSPETRVLCGIHDSSANFYRYQAGGLSDLAVVSTGTWIVLLTDRAGVDFSCERPGHACNADIMGRPMPGMLTMGGREFASVAGEARGPASLGVLKRLIETGTLALPSFGFDDGLFPGTAKQGRLEGALSHDPEARFTLAVLYAALLTARCLSDLPPARTVVLDGTFVREPLYGPLVQALVPQRRVLISLETAGTAAGAALLASHETRRSPAPLATSKPDLSGIPDLSLYQARWLERASATQAQTLEPIP